MGHGEGCWFHTAERGLDHAQPAGSWWQGSPAGLSLTKDARAGPRGWTLFSLA